MRVLHATSDWKWTGAAAPMLLLIEALRSRGHDVDLACPEPPSSGLRSLAGEARKRGIAPRYELQRARGMRLLRDISDAGRLSAWLSLADYEVVHAWHTRAHSLALRAARRRRRAGETVLVRSLQEAELPSRTPWNRWLFGPGCDGLLCVGQRCADESERLRGGRPRRGQLGAVDSGRFTPGPPGAMHEALGLPGSARGSVIGVVARIQPHRRFDLLLDAFALLVATNPDSRLLVLGRGTKEEVVARRPARDRGVADRVVFAGYRDGDYIDALRCIDLLTFLVPGSDGTCRAVLEAAACGIPCVATRRGVLPELVLEGKTGLLVDEDPVELARAWRELLRCAELRERMGRAARLRARDEFSPERLAENVETFYHALCSEKGSSRAQRGSGLAGLM